MHIGKEISGCNGMWVWQDKQRMSPPQHMPPNGAMQHSDMSNTHTITHIQSYTLMPALRNTYIDASTLVSLQFPVGFAQCRKACALLK